MNQPSFKPEYWITYEQEDAGGFGRIVGGSYGSDGWSYLIAGALPNGELQTVKEEAIVLVYENGSWSAPSQITGQNSAYVSAS